MQPISIEVIAPVLNVFYHCMHCEQILTHSSVGRKVRQEQLESYPEEVRADYERLSAWVIDLAHRYGERVRIKVIDPFTFEGFLKSLRHRLRQYPTFIIRGKKHVGWDRQELEALVQEALAS